MTLPAPKAAFNFSRFLSKEERETLSDPGRWEWITPFEASEASQAAPVPAALERRHQKWAAVKGNTHRPAHREIMLTLRGEAVYSVNGRCHLRRPGTLILLDRNETRDLKGSPDKVNFSCLWLHLLSSDFLTYYINACDEKGRYLHQLPMRPRTGDAPRLIMEAWSQCRSAGGDKLCRMLLRSLIVATLLEILGSADPVSPENHHEQVVQSLKEYIRHHLAGDLSLNNLANIAGYSPFFFHRLFLRHTGQTPVQYVNAARLVRAGELLDQNYTVQATAAALGFSSVSYFYQFFKKHVRRTPGAWGRRSRVPGAPPA